MARVTACLARLAPHVEHDQVAITGSVALGGRRPGDLGARRWLATLRRARAPHVRCLLSSLPFRPPGTESHRTSRCCIASSLRVAARCDSTLVAQPVGSVRRMVVASPAYLKRHAVPKHPRDLLKANCVRFSAGAGPWWTFYEDGKQFTVPVTGNLEFNHVAPAAEACLAGLGFGMFISYQVAQHIAQKRLRVVLASYEPPPRPIHVVYPHARLLPARTKVFIEAIKQELKDLRLMA